LSLFAELKRRNVIRVSAAYLALGWIVTEVTATVAPMLHLPEWVGPVVLWIGVIGFPFVVMFSWIYELTPEGLKRETDVEPSASVTLHTARQLDYVIIGLLVVAIGLYAFHEFRPAGDARKTLVARTAPGSVETAAGQDRSVAVLPFVDMSAGQDQEYFADGISEELLNLLAKVPQLRVIARTSSFSFKGKEVDIAEIAQKLNVANVLEGRGRHSGDKLRITAQLIRASDSSHVWSQTYDRKLTDVFAVQDEIAAAVVAQLKVTLLGDAPKTRATDPEAYALFLQAREVGRQASPAAYEQAIALFKQALAIDPSYAPAWAALAITYFGQMDLGQISMDQGLALGHAAIGKAREYDPSYALAYAYMASFEGIIERDYAAAARHLEKALALDPANVEIIGIASGIARRLGRLDLAVSLAEYNVAQDPLSVNGYASLGLAYRYTGQLDKSIEAYRKLLSIAPDAGWEHTALGDVLLQNGDANAALAEYLKEPVEVFRLAGLAHAYRALGRNAESDAAFAELTRKYPDTKLFTIATVLAERGDFDGAFATLDKAARQHDLDLGAIAVFPSFAPMHDDPRWLPLLQRLGMAPEQLEAIKFNVSVPKQ
jgi:TolB-like protein/cytochrome c-type biogenesis protein CcmH/NrfG